MVKTEKDKRMEHFRSMVEKDRNIERFTSVEGMTVDGKKVVLPSQRNKVTKGKTRKSKR